MAQIVDPADIIDFEGCEEIVDRCLLRKASSYLEQLKAEFTPSVVASTVEMFSTKLRGRSDFRPGEVTVWAGYSGHMKSTLTGQVVLDCISQKRRVMVASFEMLPQQTLARMARQAWAKCRPGAEELEQFASWTDGKLWIFDHVGQIAPSKVLGMCRYFADRWLGHQVIIDSMMMVCTSEEHLDEQKRFMTALVRLAQEIGLHIHVVAHCRKPAGGDEPGPPSKYDVRGSSAITDQAANVITIWFDQSKKVKVETGDLDPCLLKKPDALVTVTKQRNGPWEGRCMLWLDRASLRFCDDATSTVEPYAAMHAGHGRP